MAEIEEARVECAGWWCTLECTSGCSLLVLASRQSFTLAASSFLFRGRF